MSSETNKLKIGDKDNAGNVVKTIIADGPGFSIYETEKHGTMYSVSNDTKKLLTPYESRLLKIGFLANDKSTENMYSSAYARVVGLCIMKENKEIVDALLDDTEKRIVNFKIIRGRLIYFMSSIGFILPISPNLIPLYLILEILNPGIGTRTH